MACVVADIQAGGATVHAVSNLSVSLESEAS
jgi:hypothetical protein